VTALEWCALELLSGRVLSWLPQPHCNAGTIVATLTEPILMFTASISGPMARSRSHYELALISALSVISEDGFPQCPKTHSVWQRI
jgi:hypothetical protein